MNQGTFSDYHDVSATYKFIHCMAGGYAAFNGSRASYNGLYITCYSTGNASYISGGAYIRNDVGSRLSKN